MHDQLMLPYGRTTGMLAVVINKKKKELVFFKKHFPVFSRWFCQFSFNPKRSIRIGKKKRG